MGEWAIQGSENVGKIYFQNAVQNAELFLGVFTNDVGADLKNLTLYNLTEPSAPSYARVPLSPANWMISGDVATYSPVDIEVTLDSLGTIIGCFIATSDDNSGKLLAVHVFPAPVVLEFYGDRLQITPRITIT